MLGKHRHEWEPVVGHPDNYRCDCGATGWKLATGGIRPHRKEKVYDALETVGGARGFLDGMVDAAPTLDQYDRRAR